MLSPRYVTHHTLQLRFKQRGNADVTKRLPAGAGMTLREAFFKT
jgi:hypothetical protein